MTDASSSVAVKRPQLTLPEAEGAWVREAYASAQVILEYGSGGSTVLASEMPDKTVTSVESDPDWAAMMVRWFDENPPVSMPEIVPVDIGKVRQWGMPVNNMRYGQFSHYSLGVWERPGFRQPDLVLIDGRFRVGCLLACLFRSAAPVTVLFDDYTDRPEYHVAETYADRVETRGRMVRFEVTPRAIRNEELLDVVGLLQHKR
ncbi:hypothetical protein [Roseisalinus antarcticus]|uniref:Methyltransferase n=1 Tax=Roseisalinus antarcticus TaxID=254357 RepID=A0A1Y5TJN5_9RHOB|nr:hypothetical protein [Roseisalinus antarcticus]SLN65545.1 hypothetical protein ROA7023_03080 [Roseisalinus antarcticus]